MNRETAPGGTWLLLLPQLPAKPDYLRVKLWRRLQRLGAVAVKNATWALPATAGAMEDFQWLIREIEGDGGEAVLCEARFVAGLSADQMEALEEAARRSGRSGARADTTVAGASRMSQSARAPAGGIWVTRRTVYVDRIASAWMIRRHIDPDARFRFVQDDHVPEHNEIRFDMYEAEYTHLGDSCTFEVLASIFEPADPAIAAIGEVVHDIDLKDDRFRRPETAGVKLLLDGIAATEPTDEARLERGFRLFDDLYAGFRQSEVV
jgi:hypothetical protein